MKISSIKNTVKEFALRNGANRVVIVLSIARLGDAIGNSIVFIVIPLYVAQLPSPLFPFPQTVRVGILISLFGLITSCLQPVMGTLSDRLGKRKLLIQVGLALMAVSTLSFILASKFNHLLYLRSIQGVGVALTIPASMALMVASTKREYRGGSMGIFTTLRMMGFGTGPLIGGYLIDHYGFRSAFYTGTACIVIGIILVQLFVSEIPISGRVIKPLPFFHRDVLTPGILATGLVTLVMACAVSMMITLEKQFNTRLHQSVFSFGIAFSALMVSRVLFQIPLGRLSDRIGRRPVIVSGLLFLAPVTALLGVVGTTDQLILLRILQGLASAAIAAPALALAGDLSTVGNEARQMSIITSSFGFGIAIGPLLSGILAVHSFELPFFVGGILVLMGAGLALRYVPETIHRNE